MVLYSYNYRAICNYQFNANAGGCPQVIFAILLDFSQASY